jgi:hypothetical protein
MIMCRPYVARNRGSAPAITSIESRGVLPAPAQRRPSVWWWFLLPFDVNHVPAGWIALSLQLPRPLADQIVAARERRGGFRLADELVIYCDEMTGAAGRD